jgi:uncharacterized glyoxalase superfamily protein PhnB
VPPRPLPPGYHSVNPYIVVDDADQLITFIVDVFGGRDVGITRRPDGGIDHADVYVGDSIVMISGASDRWPARPCVQFVYVDDVDAVYRTALRAGAESILAPTDQPYGDRVGGVHDPSGNRWWIATHVRDFST